MAPEPRAFRYIGRKRRPREDRRFLAGSGRFVADVALDGMAHVALVASPYPHARIVGIDAVRAQALPGVRTVVTGEELARATDPLMSGLDLPKVLRYPLAVGRARYVGEWVAAVVADSRALAEDAAELVEIAYEPLPHIIDPEAALGAGAPLVHEEHGSNLLYRRAFVWGPVEADFAASPHRISYRARWHRSATVPIETFGVVARWDASARLLDVWASIQMPKFPDQLARALRLPGNAVRTHFDIDVGGSYGGKRGLKHSVLAGYLARRIGAPVRLVEEDARARRCRRLCRPRAVSARQAGGRDRRPLPHQERRLRADQRHHQQDAGRGGARLRPGAHQFRDRDRHGSGRPRAWPRPDRAAPAQPHPQRRVSLRDSERQLLRQRRLSRRAGEGARRRGLSRPGAPQGRGARSP
jgi:CO/xanthine dehydrogenase Mo-binding subunit